MAEHVAHNDLVPGSNPGRPTSGTLARCFILARGTIIMRKKSRGGARLIELAIFGVLVLVIGVVLAFVTGMTSISAFFSPKAPTAPPVALAGHLPTPAPTVTR